MRPSRTGLPLPHAVALGLLHGPAELLPVSSSAHVTLVPGLAGWPYGALAPEVRKAFEVALHAGTLAGAAHVLGRPRPWFAAVSVAPAALVGAMLEGPVERRLGSPRGIALGLLAGSALLLAGERAGRRAHAARTAADARPADALALGLAQAAALVPGLSRSGLTYAAARARGFGAGGAAALSREAAAPVLAGATVLKGVRLARGGLPAGLAAPFAAGALAAALGARAAAPLARRPVPVRAAVAERCALALATLARPTPPAVLRWTA
ncbi:undecaprenyl-diphosphate phosphatase [Conexibacter sp. SYSU D00693]|uniref:undecaprenyl-diphosphate phosphatase n=1 Tax=Conexibacter sp. SYSU D00693 TaxID=2812560 RepID=UPI00196A9593|nr:undecaprenyl-diphosphate phosphatase [Conexibacter sp. SYSU D00693]